jgi:hypothetical protein
MGKLGAILDLFRYGGEVANVESWKRGQVTVNSLVALLAAVVALARAAGYDIPVSNDGIAAIAGGLFAAVNLVFTVVTSSRASLPLLPAKVQPVSEPEAVRTGPEPSATVNAVDQHARDYPPDRGGGG